MSKSVISLDYDPSTEPLYHAIMSIIEGHTAGETMPALMAAISHVLVVDADGDRDRLVSGVTEAFRVVMKGSIDLREIAERIRKDHRNPDTALQAARIAAQVKNRGKQ